MNYTVLVILLLFYIYCALGSVALRIWRRRTHPRRPATMAANPDAWLAYWLPQTVAVELFALLGVGGAVFLLTVTTPLLTDQDKSMYRLDFILGVVGCAVVFAVLDIVVIVLARWMVRRQAGAHAHDAAPHP